MQFLLGSTAYVLTEQPEGGLRGDYWLWNASTGEHFQAHGSNCPLQSVGSAFNADNVRLSMNEFSHISAINC